MLCAERLCEESFHDFSPKLNDENLTKCLQTLKYMYYDLSLEEVICPREHEFRAYDVLMNLNQGDTLREVQTLGAHLRYHDRVRFALKCFAALNSNNYVSFFKLVRKATFLEACILKRYFYQVRRCALEVIQRAFTPGKGLVQMPLDSIHQQLGFESYAAWQKETGKQRAKASYDRRKAEAAAAAASAAAAPTSQRGRAP